MYNDLIQKNAELGKFLFCERYTLQPVKNALYIAEGQDLKRGAVVDVNGVLVGTNSLMPYAVLENDCDTRAKGAFASVFVKGEFNFDKLFFADGLSKDDIDNIVYNGIGIGLVIKPYEYAEGFSPFMVPKGTSKENPILNAVEVEELYYSLLSITPHTIRFSFSNPNYSPLTSPNPYDRGYREGTWTKLETNYANIWDYQTDDSVTDWTREFCRTETHSVQVNEAGAFSYPNKNWNLTKILKIDFTGITNAQLIFGNCLDIIALPEKFDNTDSIESMSNAFRSLYRCTKFPKKLDLPALTEGLEATDGLYNLFHNCFSMTKQTELILPEKDINVQWLFSNCESLTNVKCDLTHCSNLTGFASGCSSLREVDIKTSAEATNMYYMLSRTMNLKKINPLITTNVTNVANMLSASTGAQETYDYTLYDGSERNFRKEWDISDKGNGFSEVPSLVFPAATNCAGLYRGRDGIDTIPDLSQIIPNVENANHLFRSCENIKFGMVEAYNFLLSRGSALTTHNYTFSDCGINTEEGRAARALIPKSWGGDAEG